MKLLAIINYTNITAGKVYECLYAGSQEVDVICDLGYKTSAPISHFVFVDENGVDLLDAVTPGDDLYKYMKAIMDNDVDLAAKHAKVVKSMSVPGEPCQLYVAMPVRDSYGCLVGSTEYALTPSGVESRYVGDWYRGALEDYTPEMCYAWNVLHSTTYYGKLQQTLDYSKYTKLILESVPSAIVSKYDGDDIMKALKVACELLGL